MVHTEIRIHTSPLVLYRGSIPLQEVYWEPVFKGVAQGNVDVLDRSTLSPMGRVRTVEGRAETWLDVTVWLPPGHEGQYLREIWFQQQFWRWELWHHATYTIGALERV